jgi:hypothetical protein
MPRLSNPRWEKFCQLFTCGNADHDPDNPDSPPNTLHNGVQSYFAAGFVAKNYNTAAVCAHRMMKREVIRDRINEIRDELEEIEKTRLFRWMQLMPHAQSALLDALAGKKVSKERLAAAREIIAQAAPPPALRFKDMRTGKEGSAFPVFVLGMDDQED